MPKKKDMINEVYTIKTNAELYNDISSSSPLKKRKEKTQEKIGESLVVENIVEKEPTQKEIYQNMVLENIPFVLKINSNIIFDSEKQNIMNLYFEDNCFRLGFDVYPYDGLNFKYKK